MALDLAVLGSDGRPEFEIPIGHSMHTRLVDLANIYSLPRLHQIWDYYEDVTYDVDEVEAFVRELQGLRAIVSHDQELVDTLDLLIQLGEIAIERGLPLLALAD